MIEETEKEEPIKREDIVLRKLDESMCVADFDCGTKELNDFLKENAWSDYQKRMSVTYVLLHKKYGILAYYSILTDRVDTKLDPLRRTLKDKLKRKMEYRYTSMPAIKIGRLAVAKRFQSADNCEVHLGQMIVSGLKYQYAQERKFGCRLLTVDALNNERTIHFYKDKNGFIPMIAEKDTDPERTVPMFFDLATMEKATE